MSYEDYVRMINKTEDYIEANLSQSITLEAVSRNVYLSEYHFHRVFSKYSKETLNQFITRIKMERSAIYLSVNNKISITEIAHNYGYNSSSSYNKAFKKHFGMNPTDFRKRARMEKK
ncbi:MAG: AraC family transcriptional regulator [Firmicutes bacterium]|nr:AraC family transcriptional regulator [Bacillota bacterium]